MMKGQGAPVMDYFRELDDPRIERSKRHQLPDIVAIAICGADSWVYVAMFGRSKEEWFRSFLDLPNGIPSYDTLRQAQGDVFSRLDPEQFQSCFVEWTQAVAALLPGEVVAIDGKTVRRSHDRRTGRQAIHLVSAWASPELAEGQHSDIGAGKDGGEVQRDHRHSPAAVDAGTERRLVTVDAMGCQKEIAQGIVDRGVDYLLAVKENQGQLYQDVHDLFEAGDGRGLDGLPHDYAATLNKGHGRIERRECWAIDDPACLEYLGTAGDWPGLRSVVKVECRREAETGATVQARYYISS